MSTDVTVTNACCAIWRITIFYWSSMVMFKILNKVDSWALCTTRKFFSIAHHPKTPTPLKTQVEWAPRQCPVCHFTTNSTWISDTVYNVKAANLMVEYIVASVVRSDQRHWTLQRVGTCIWFWPNALQNALLWIIYPASIHLLHCNIIIWSHTQIFMINFAIKTFESRHLRKQQLPFCKYNVAADATSLDRIQFRHPPIWNMLSTINT